MNKAIKSPDMLLRQADEDIYNSKKIKHKKSGKETNIIKLTINKENSGKKN